LSSTRARHTRDAYLLFGDGGGGGVTTTRFSVTGAPGQRRHGLEREIIPR